MKSKKIIFQDNYGKVITPTQAELLGFYCKLIYSDNELKIKIYFFNNMVNGAEYYLSKNEDANAAYKRGLLFENNGSLLYNIALVYEKKFNDKKNAISYYEQYLKTVNEKEQPKLVNFIKNKIAELKK